MRWNVLALVLAGSAVAVAGYWLIRLRRSRLRVETRTGSAPESSNPRATYLIIEAVNEGRRTVTVNRVGFTLTDDRLMVLPEGSSRPMPARLRSGERLTVWIPPEKLAPALRRLGYGFLHVRGWVGETDGRIHTGSGIDLRGDGTTAETGTST